MKAALSILLSLVIVCSIQTSAADSNGDYLGQKPPGMTPGLFAPGVVSSGAHDMDITITPRGDEIFFSRSGPDYFSAMLRLIRVNGKWQGPLMAPFPNVHSITYPFVSPDGKTLYFETNGDIHVSRKGDDGWSSPARLGPGVNTDRREGFVSAGLSGNLYFSRIQSDTPLNVDIYVSEYVDGEYGSARPLSESINSEHNEFHACVSPNEEYIVFDSDRPGGFGRNDLYVSFRRKDGAWTEARNLGEPVNTETHDMRPYITPDGNYLFFSTTRSTREESEVSPEGRESSYDEFMRKITGPGNGSQDIYWTDTKILERFRPAGLQ